MSSTGLAIGIDIGGTKTVVAAVESSGQPRSRAEFATDSNRGFSACVAELIAVIRTVAREAEAKEDELCGIGIGCAGPVDPRRGTIHNPYTLPGWDDADIVAPLREAFHLPVRLENDADAAAVGEYRWGAGRGASPLVMVTLGTGIGGALLVNGEIYRGVNGEHPELGHLAVRPDGPDCYCGTRGCWESIASGTAIAAAGKRFGFADSRAVFAAASGDANAAAVVREAVEATASAVWTLIHAYFPQRIVLGGGIGVEHFERFAAVLRPRLSLATQLPRNPPVEIAKAALGREAGVIGAASLAFSKA
jgi:glucokinase